MATRTVPTAAVTLGAAALLTAAMTAASAAPAAPAPAASAPAARAASATVSVQQAAVRRPVHRPVLVDCFWHARVQPKDFVLACGDGNSLLDSLRWSSWGVHSATAQGVNWVNDCKPYCAVGKFHPYRVTVRLDRAETWKRHPALVQFTRMRLYYPDGRPDGYKPVMTLSLWN